MIQQVSMRQHCVILIFAILGLGIQGCYIAIDLNDRVAKSFSEYFVSLVIDSTSKSISKSVVDSLDKTAESLAVTTTNSIDKSIADSMDKSTENLATTTANAVSLSVLNSVRAEFDKITFETNIKPLVQAEKMVQAVDRIIDEHDKLDREVAAKNERDDQDFAEYFENFKSEKPTIPKFGKKAVVPIEYDGGFFSGVVFTHDGLILTAKHCLPSKKSNLFAIINNEKIRAKPVYISEASEGPVVLNIEKDKLTSIQLEVEQPKIGDVVFVVGFPIQGRSYGNLALSEGVITGKSWRQSSVDGHGQSIPIKATANSPGAFRVYDLTAAATSGMSGGAVINSKGRLIGILSIAKSDGSTSNCIVLSDVLKAVDATSYENKK